MSPEGSLPEPRGLTDEQRVVLQAIGRRPEASQSEIAEVVGVSASTVNRKLHKIEGFAWERRNEIVDQLLPTAQAAGTGTIASDGGVGYERQGI